MVTVAPGRRAAPDPVTAGCRPPPAVVCGSGRAFPAGRSQQDYWDHFYRSHAGQNRWARRVFLSAGCSFRHTAVDPTLEDISGWTTGRRMERYLGEALPLAATAAGDALRTAGLDVADLGLLAVVSCTGYVTPGLDIRLAEALGAPPALQRLLVGHMGCYAALPALASVADTVTARRRPALLVCAEVASLHVQPGAADLEQVVAHAIFSDGAAAVALEPAGPGTAGLEVLDAEAVTDVGSADHMRWDITDLGFRMGLSRHVPGVLAGQVGPLVDRLLGRHGLDRGDVHGWAVHPGGPRILDVVADALGLDDGDLAPARRILDEHGNCSSPTVLMVLDELLAERPPPPGAPVVAMAFGPGLTCWATLLRATGG
jgi:alkylresorcinol/alkylpyrone synthase